jgi:hypothetical protein
LVAIVCLQLGSTRAFGQGTDPAKAETLINEANRLRSQGQSQKALPLMKEAYDLAPSPRTAGQLGLAEMAVGYWQEADHHLDEALAAPGHPWVAKHRGPLESAQKQVRTHLVTFDLDGSPAGAEVLVNGQVVGRLPVANLTLAEGRVRFVVRAPGYLEQSKEVTNAGGGKAKVTFDLSPAETVEKKVSPPPPLPPALPPPLPPPPKVEEASAGPSRILPISLAAGAGVALGFGIWQHIAWQGAVSDFDNADGCYAGLPMRGTDKSCQGLYDSVQTHRTLTYVGYGAAGVLAIGAGVAYWLGSSSSQSSVERHDVSLTSVTVGARDAPFSLRLGGTF